MPQPGLVDPRLLAFDPSAILRAASQGLQLVDQFGNVQDASAARRENDAIRSGRIDAANARNLLNAEQATAGLSLLPAETSARSGQLALAESRNAGDLRLEPARQSLDAQKLQLDQGSTGFALETQPTEQRIARGANELTLAGQDLQKADQDLKKGTQAIEKLKNDADLAVQQETNKFIAANPQATAQQLEAAMLGNQRVLQTAKAYQDFLVKNPDFDTAGLETQKATMAAQRAVADATVRSGGVTPNQGIVNPNREFTTREARNLADANKALQFGGLDQVRAFQATPEGQAIISAILTAPQNLPVRLSPQQRTAIETFRTRNVAPAPAPAAAPVPGAVPPQAQAVPIQPPQSAVAFLRANPQQAAAFEQKYGVSAATYLGQ